MRARSVAVSQSLLVLAAALAFDGGCEGGAPKGVDAATPPPPTSAEARSGASSSSTSANATAPSPHGDLDAGARPACRIVSSENGPSASANPMTWLTLADHSAFSTRATESGREMRFEGPGRVRACGGETALILEGGAVALPGGGEAPGAEQWVSSPCAVVRWAGGVHRVTVGKDECRLQASVGTAYLYVPADVRVDDAPMDAGAPDSGAGSGKALADGGLPAVVDSFRRVDARRALRVRGVDGGASWSSPKAVTTGLVACEVAGDAVRKLADEMADAGTAGLGDRAARSVTARRLARAACAVAEARVAAAGDKPDDTARLSRAARGILSP